MRESPFNVNDKVWFAFGHFLVRCSIVSINDFVLVGAEKEYGNSAGAYYFYDVDEPVGHQTAEYEIYKSLEEAIAELKKENTEIKIDDVMDVADTLEIYREQSIIGISEFNKDLKARLEKTPAKEYIKKFPNKEFGKDWFYLYEDDKE